MVKLVNEAWKARGSHEGESSCHVIPMKNIRSNLMRFFLSINENYMAAPTPSQEFTYFFCCVTKQLLLCIPVIST
jgi:hypothetical protein